MQRRLREDPTEAVQQSLAHIIALVGKEHTAIVQGKRGNTTSTFYPDGCTTSTSNDGMVRDDASSSSCWDTVHDYTSSPDAGASPDNCNAENYMAGAGKAGNGNWRIIRGFFLFDTSAIGDSDTIDFSDAQPSWHCEIQRCQRWHRLGECRADLSGFKHCSGE